MPTTNISARLEYLRGEINAERISWGELAELQGYAAHINPSDTQLLEWAGVPEHTGITEEGLALGHRYIMGNANAYCPQCSKEHSEAEGRNICVLDYDQDK